MASIATYRGTRTKMLGLSVQEIPAEVVLPLRCPGRPKGSRNRTMSGKVRHPELLGVRYSSYAEIPPELWNLLVSMILGIFRGLLEVAKRLKREAPGNEQESLLFVDVPRVFAH